MRRGRLPWLMALALLGACDDGTSGDPGDGTVPVDVEPPADVGPDPEPDMAPSPCDGQPCDMGGPDADVGACAPAAGALPGDVPFENRSWRLTLQSAQALPRLTPDCGGPVEDATGGEELTVRFTPEVDGEHLFVIAGRYTALYAVPSCEEDVRPDGCLVVETPFDEGATRAGRQPVEAGVPIDIVIDAAGGLRAGPATVVVFPPVPLAGDCSAIGPSGVRPACAPGAECVDDVCFPAGPADPDVLGAWSDGQSLRVSLQLADPRGEVVEAVWAAVDDRAPAQLTVTMVARDNGDLTLQGFVEDRRLAEAQAVELELLDAEGRVARHRVDVEPAPLQPIDGPCDADGIVDACDGGAACVEGTCTKVQAGLWTFDGLGYVSVRMPTVADDAPILAAVARARVPDGGAPPWQPLPRLAADEGRRWGVAGVPLEVGARGAQMRIEQANRPPSLPVQVEPTAQPERDLDAPCDLDLIEDRCGPRTACVEGEAGATCLGIDPPTIDGLRGWAGDDAIGLYVEFSDPQGDAAFWSWQLTAEEGEYVAGIDEPWLLSEEAIAEGALVASLPADEYDFDPEPGLVLIVLVFDAQGQPSEPARIRLEPAPAVGPGVPCDPLGGLNVCADEEHVCVSLDNARLPQCQPLDEGCDEWRPLPLDVPIANHNDTHRRGPDRTAGLCGGAGSPEVVFELEIREPGRFRAEVNLPDAVLYVRRFCRFPVPDQSEIACGAGAVEFDAEPDEAYFLFVDGPGEMGARFTLDLEQIEAFDPEPEPEPEPPGPEPPPPPPEGR